MTSYDENDEYYGVAERQSELRRKMAFGIIGTSFVGSLCLISPFVIMQLKTPLPFMSTPKEKILSALKEIMNFKRMEGTIKSSSVLATAPKKAPSKKLTFYDLGSGDGEAVLAAASLGWKAIGIEMNPTLYLVSSIRRLFSPPLIRQNSSFVLGDMWKQKLNDADAVMIFGVVPIIPKVAQKFSNECQPGTYLMSYRFQIPTKNGSQTHNSEKAIDATLAYDKKEMRLYRLNDKS